MTLILGMTKADGIYLSVDFRVTRAGAIEDDVARKLLQVHYPPFEDGPRALLGFTGLATLPDGTPIGTWIRETLRGEAEPFNESMAHLRDRLDRDIGPLGHGLIINGLVIHGSQRYLVALSNMKIDGGTTRVVRRFGYICDELRKGFVFANGSGAAIVAVGPHLDLLRSQLSVVPRRTIDHLKLLATVNRGVAEVEPSVSPHCHVSFLNADDRRSPTGRTFTEGMEIPFEMPLLLAGLDLSGFTRDFHEQAEKFFKDGTPLDGPDAAQVNQDLKRRP